MSRKRILVLRDVVITTLLLGGFAITGTALVAVVHTLTEARVEANRLAVIRQRVTELLAGLTYDNDPVQDTRTLSHPRLGGQDLPVWFARQEGQIVGLVLSAVAPQGYSGDIHLLIGLDLEGTLRGVRVTRHRETPGLGDAIEAERSSWIHGFTGRSLQDPPPERWRVRRDGGVFDQFTGATITPRAVVGAVREALLFYAEEGERLRDMTRLPQVLPEPPVAP
jgi:electron transport complex protein RnfG